MQKIWTRIFGILAEMTPLQKAIFYRKEHKDHKEIKWKSLCPLCSLWFVSAFSSRVSRNGTQIAQIATETRRIGGGSQDSQDFFSALCASLRSLRLKE
jgi:hypothetical protein